MFYTQQTEDKSRLSRVTLMSQFRQTPFRKTALPKLTAMRAHSGTNSWKVQLMTHLWHKENNEKPNRIRERERSRGRQIQ